jgi:phage terminase small subunit
MALTARQQRFVDEYLVDLNATRAAMRAGYGEGGASSAGSRLLATPEVAAAVTDAKAERSARTMITADRVVTELARIAFSDIRKVVSWRGPDEADATAEEGARTAAKAVATVEVAASDALDDDAAAAIAEISRGRDGTLKVKLHDKRAALVQLGHHLGVFRPRADANEAADGLEELLRDVDGRTRGIPEGA